MTIAQVKKAIGGFLVLESETGRQQHYKGGDPRTSRESDGRRSGTYYITFSEGKVVAWDLSVQEVPSPKLIQR